MGFLGSVKTSPGCTLHVVSQSYKRMGQSSSQLHTVGAFSLAVPVAPGRWATCCYPGIGLSPTGEWKLKRQLDPQLQLWSNQHVDLSWDGRRESDRKGYVGGVTRSEECPRLPVLRNLGGSGQSLLAPE